MSAYWQYLAEASVSLQLLSKRSIKNQQGLVYPPGSIVDSELIDIHAEHYSTNDIESLFYIEHADFDGQFRNDLMATLDSISTLKEIYSPAEHNHYVNAGLSLLNDYREIVFRLNIMKVCLPFEYSRTLFCLWLCIFDSEEMERSDRDFQALFLCGLCHDVGLLDVSTHFTRIDHDPRSSKDDIKGYYEHAHFSARFIERLNDIPNKVILGIEQHHENMDGTGYPAGKSGTQLLEYGQCIHLFDTLYSIYTKSYKPLNKSLADLIPVIEINAVTHFGQAAVRLVTLFKRANRTKHVFFKKEEFRKIQLETDAMANYIEQSIGVIQAFTESVGFRHEDKTVFVLQNSFIHIVLAYYKLRVLHKQAMLMDAVAEEGEYMVSAKALEDNFLTLREIIFHINKFLYRLRIYLREQSEGMIRDRVVETIDSLSKLTIKLMH